MKFLFVILCLLFIRNAVSQETVTIWGTVYDAKTHEVINGVNVILQSTTGKFLYGFGLTDAQGNYSITYKGKKDTLLITISGFNVKKESKIIRPVSQQVDFMVQSTNIEIKEVVIKARPIEHFGDTITYNVSSFIDLTDHNIGDVLRKMPGIEVEKNGKIKYNGLDISKFYIEGLDMFEGRYGVATNNIRAKDIARIEIMENHQPIKVLKELTLPERAAINLRLKSSSSGIWNGSVQAGLGYKPVIWNAEATAMYFGRNFQSLSLYKTNSMGNDISNELASHYSGNEEDDLSALLGIHKPSTPPIDKLRYLDNNIHLVSTNTINKLKEGVTLATNAYYMHDSQNSQSKSVTTYYLPTSQVLIISEATDACHRTDRTGVNMSIEKNAETFYVKDRIEFSGEWIDDKGNVTNETTPVTQHYNRPYIAFKNVFEGTRKIGNLSFNLSSTIDYSSAPATLSVTPMPFPEIFKNDENISGAVQQLDSKRFRIRNSAYTSFAVKKWRFYMKANADSHMEWLQSSLMPMSATLKNNAAMDEMRNNTYWARLDLLLGPSIAYFSKFIYASLDCPLNLMNLEIKDKIRNGNQSQKKLFLRPTFYATLTLTRNLKFSIHAFYQENHGGLYDSYGGYIMTDYRVIVNKKGEISHERNQNYSASITYADVLKALFGSLTASYYYSRRNLMYGTTYEGSLSRIEAVKKPNTMDGYILYGKISKRLSGIRTTLNFSSRYSQSRSDILRENNLMSAYSEQFSSSVGVNIRFCPSVLFDYDMSYVWNQYHIKNAPILDAIHMIQQEATLSFIASKKVVCSIHTEHYYNGAIETGNRNMFFLDSKVQYHTKRMEYAIEARNLLAKKNFHSASYSDATNYMQVYQLRPSSIMFNLKIYF